MITGSRPKCIPGGLVSKETATSMPKAWKEFGRYGGVGIELVLAILILSGIGHWVDVRRGGGSDLGMTIGFLLGIVVGVRNLVRAARHMQKDIERAEARDPEASRWTVDESWLHKGDQGADDPPN
jgi:F0F1-type ATP synthase assembly protein I